jgi:predicted CxxxxCH...CXXCH cytochrome family protein
MRPAPVFPLAALVVALGSAACGAATAPPPASDQGCTACHGDPGRAGSATEQAAPPLDTHAQSSTTLVSVGAHQAHLSNGVPCATCHVVPPAGDRTHIDGPYATVTFSGNVVGAGNAVVAPWSHDVATCANYCHGGIFPAAARPAPAWTFQGTLGCAACHSDQVNRATTTGLHRLHLFFVAPLQTCAGCHGAGYATSSVTTPATATHVDGSVNVLPAVGWQDPRCASFGPNACFATCHTAAPACKVWQ